MPLPWPFAAGGGKLSQPRKRPADAAGMSRKQQVRLHFGWHPLDGLEPGTGFQLELRDNAAGRSTSGRQAWVPALSRSSDPGTEEFCTAAAAQRRDRARAATSPAAATAGLASAHPLRTLCPHEVAVVVLVVVPVAFVLSSASSLGGAGSMSLAALGAVAVPAGV